MISQLQLLSSHGKKGGGRVTGPLGFPYIPASCCSARTKGPSADGPCDRAQIQQFCRVLITSLPSHMSLICRIMNSTHDQEKSAQFGELLFIEKLSRLLFRAINSDCFSTVISVLISRTMTNTQEL